MERLVQVPSRHCDPSYAESEPEGSPSPLLGNSRASGLLALPNSDETLPARGINVEDNPQAPAVDNETNEYVLGVTAATTARFNVESFAVKPHLTLSDSCPEGVVQEGPSLDIFLLAGQNAANVVGQLEPVGVVDGTDNVANEGRQISAVWAEEENAKECCKVGKYTLSSEDWMDLADIILS